MKLKMNDVVDEFKKLSPPFMEEIITCSERLCNDYDEEDTRIEHTNKIWFGKDYQKGVIPGEIWLERRYRREKTPNDALKFLKRKELLSYYVNPDENREHECVYVRIFPEKLKEFILKVKEASDKPDKDCKNNKGKKAKNSTKGYVLSISEIGKKFQMLINGKVFGSHNKSSPYYPVYKLLLKEKGRKVYQRDMNTAVIDKNSRILPGKDLHTFLRNLCPNKDIKSVFFEVIDTKNNETILLKEYVTKEELRNNRIQSLKDVDGKEIVPVDIFHPTNKSVKH